MAIHFASFSPVNKPKLRPGINWGHPLAKDLIGCWLMNEGSGAFITNLCTGEQSAFTNKPTWNVTCYGTSMKFVNASSQWVGLSSLGRYQNRSLTIVISYRPADAATAAVRTLFSVDDSTNGVGFAFNYNQDSLGFPANAGFFAAWMNDGSTWHNAASSSAVLTNGVQEQLTAVLCDANFIRIYKGGRLEGTTSLSTHISYGAGSKVYLGRDAKDGNYISGDVGYVYLYRRALHQMEISSLARLPYQFLQKPRTFYGRGPSGVTPSTAKGIMTPRFGWWGDL